MKSIIDYTDFNDKQAQNYLAANYPKGKLTAQRFTEDTEIYIMILCIASYVKHIVGLLFEFVKNRDIDRVEELLDEWEESVGIPSRYPYRDTLEGRREAIKRLISKFPVYNLTDGYSGRAVDVDSTFEQYILETTGVTTELEGTPTAYDYTEYFYFTVNVDVEGEDANNQFPLPFPISFFDRVVDETTKKALNAALDDIIPIFCNWRFEVLT